MKKQRNILHGLAIILLGVIGLTAQAQPKNNTPRLDFSGEWKAKESIAMGGNIVCCYNSGDRMLAKTMKIATHSDLLDVAVLSAFPGAALVKSQEKLAFDGKQSKIDHGGGRGKEFTVKLSGDGQTITVKSVVHLMVATPYHVNVQKKLIVNVTEVWKLSNDGRSIIIQTKARSNDFSNERSWKTVFEKVS